MFIITAQLGYQFLSTTHITASTMSLTDTNTAFITTQAGTWQSEIGTQGTNMELKPHPDIETVAKQDVKTILAETHPDKAKRNCEKLVISIGQRDEGEESVCGEPSWSVRG